MIVVIVGVFATAGLCRWALVGDQRDSARRRLDGSTVAPPRWFHRLLEALEIGAPADRAWPAARKLGSMGLLLVVWWWPQALLVGAVGATVWFATGPARARRRRARGYDAEVAAVVDALVPVLAAGGSLHSGFEAAAARSGVVGEDLRSLVATVQRGAPLQESLDAWAADAPSSGPKLVADALALTGRSGGSHLGALEGVSATLRERAGLSREVRALGTQARLSAAVLTVTPVGFAAVAAMLDARMARFLVGTPAGWACLGLGLAFDGLGAWWMHRLTGSVE